MPRLLRGEILQFLFNNHDDKTEKAKKTYIKKVYFKGSKVKLEIALAKGKKLHDKRETKKTKEVERKLRQGIYE